jgi:hypothetical protein
VAKHVTVRWARNTAQDIGSEIGDWTVDEIERDGDRIVLIRDNEIIAEFGRYDADVFLVEDEDEPLEDEDEDEPLEDEDEDEDEDEPLEDDDDEDEPLEDEDEDEPLEEDDDEAVEDEDEGRGGRRRGRGRGRSARR